MKSILPIAAAFALLAGPVLAQNAGQIASVQGGGSCPRCNLFQADLSGREMAGRSFQGARLRQSDMSLAVMNRTNFSGADLRDVSAFGGVFSSSNFAGADLTNSNWVGAFFGAANFRGAVLQGANLSGADLHRVTGLSQGQLNTACGDQATRLPRSLSIPSC